MRVLVACEFSGVVRNAFLARGHDAYSCDVYPGLKPPFDRHLQEDVEPLLKGPWDLVIAHPPCTYLAHVGAWLVKKDPGRLIEMVEACRFFRACLNANSPKVCVENPRQLKRATKIIGVRHDQVIQPYEHGHHESKATLIWLKGLPPLTPTNVVENRGSEGWINKTLKGSGVMRQLSRSIFYPGIAKAMAEQWS